MTSPTPIISVRNISVRFPGVLALDDVSLEIRQGELLAIVGENGAGKSTLMKVLAGVYSRYEGQLLLRGEPVRFQSTRDAEHAGVSIIHQELNLVEQLSVAANIFLGRERRGFLGMLDERSMNAAAETLLNELECRTPPTQLVGKLRVGDQQLVEIAKALSLQSDIVIMDEPTSALTEAESERLMRIIARLKAKGVTIIYISHKMDEVFRLADRITVLRDGKLVTTVLPAESSPRSVAHLMVGREIENASQFEPRVPGPVMLEVRNVTLAWPGHAQKFRLRDVSLSVRAGEVLGIAGLMGAGRTELLECLYGSSRVLPTGEIFVNGTRRNFRHPAQALAAGVALVTEDRKRLGLFADLNVGQNITLCQLQDALRAGFINNRSEREMAEGIVEKLHVKTAGIEARITNLSGGNQQKCIIGRGLLTRPKILLLDDPTRGVDVGAKAELYRLIDGLCREGLAVIVTSSELPELLTLSDRILVLCEGRVTGHFTRAEATEQKIMEAATARQAVAV
ncbi:MAG: sugar ABC transporter ATP-binding protein [Planctomycetes bacterium]|nr:sugar ABC transporter ATP-binding protein [Planctomycetota bacterium]